MSRTRDLYQLIERTRREGLIESRVVSEEFEEIWNTGYDCEGRLLFRIPLRRGKLHGMARMWYPNGELESEEPFHKGIVHGLQRSWYSDGKPRREVKWTNGYLNGIYREWFSNGTLKSECFYRVNSIEGPSTEWWPNGCVHERGNYLNGLRHGIWTVYDARGELRAKAIYIRGERSGGRMERMLLSGGLTAQRIRRMRNQPLRRMCLEELGYERLLVQSPHNVIDTGGEYSLHMIDWHPQEEPVCVVKVKCPSTGAFYTLRVPPTIKTVSEAVAWTFGLTPDQYFPNQES